MDNSKYISSPVSSDYKSKNAEVVSNAIKLSKQSKRLMGSFGKTVRTSAPTSFKYFESTLFSTKDVKFTESDPSMLDSNFIESVKYNKNRIYNVLRFDREHNIKSFDFTLTYKQLADWGADRFKSVPVTRTFIGSIVFTGCSNVKNTATYENIPLEAHVRFESIGDSVGSETSIDGFGDNKGGPSITFTYSYTKDYVYLFVSSISPFRLIPKNDGTFVDISYAEGRGSFINEAKEIDSVEGNRLTGANTNLNFSANKDIHCDLSIAIKETSISSSNDSFEQIDIGDSSFTDNKDIVSTNAKSFTIRPTKGEVVTYGMTPGSDVDLEIAAEISPVKYTSRLLPKDMDSVKNYVEKLENLIKDSSTSVDKVPFVIKTTIRNKSKYNVRGDYYVDSESDSLGDILIEEVGTYDAKADKFDVIEYVFDRSTAQDNKTVKEYYNFIHNTVSNWLSKYANNDNSIERVNRSDSIMKLIKNINYPASENIEVYSEVSFIRASSDFNVVNAFVELKSDNGVEDRVIYFCDDKSVRLCNFKDYDMIDPIIVYPFEKILDIAPENNGVVNSIEITSVTRTIVDSTYKYFISTNKGLILECSYSDDKIDMVIDAIHNVSTSDSSFATDEIVTDIKSDNNYIFFSSNKGNLAAYKTSDKSWISFTITLSDDEKITAIDDSNDKILICGTTKRIFTIDIDSKEVGVSRLGFLEENTRFDHINLGMDDNCDLMPDVTGFAGVPTVQCGLYRYYLGLRLDSSGYVEVYKRVNLQTGSVDNCKVPENRVYGAVLAADDRYIYSIGGSYSDEIDPSNPSELKDHISIYDTFVDEWKTLSDIVFTNDSFDGDSVNRKLYKINAIINNKSVYIAKPRIKYFTKNALTDDYVPNIIIDSCCYKIDFDDEFTTATVSKIAIATDDSDAKLKSIANGNYSLYPINSFENKIRFIYGTRKLETVDDVSNFVGYDLGIVTFNTSDNSFEISNEQTYIDSYLSNKHSASIVGTYEDLFVDSSIAHRGSDFIALILEKGLFTSYISGDKVSYKLTPLYNANTDVSDTNGVHVENSKGLLCDNELAIEWSELSDRVNPLTLSISIIKNRAILVGGHSLRVPVIIDISDFGNLERIATASTINRVSSDPYSGVLNPNNVKDYIRVVSTFGLECESIATASVGNTEFAILKIKNELKPSIYRFSKSHDKSFVWMTDVDCGNAPDRYNTGYKAFVLGRYVMFYPETSCFKSGDSWLTSSSSKDYETKIIVYDTVNLTVGTISVEDSMLDRFVLQNDALNQILLGYTTETNEFKAFEFIVDSFSGTLTSSIVDFGSAKNPVTELCQNDSIVSGGSFGGKSFLVLKNDIVILDFNNLVSNSIVTKTVISNVFEENVLHRCTKIAKENVYVFGGDSCHNIYKLKLSDMCKSSGLIRTERSVSNVDIVDTFTPAFISSDKVFVYGKRNYTSGLAMATVSECNLNDITFTKPYDVIAIEKNTASKYNRYNPNLHTITVDGVNLLLVFGGKQGTNTDVTKSVDVYDLSRRKWASLPDLPIAIKNPSFQENTIVGSTKINDDGSEEFYPHKFTLVCKNLKSFDFEWKDEIITTNRTLPVITRMCESKDGETIYGIGIDSNKKVLNTTGSIVKYTKTEDGYSGSALPLIQNIEAHDHLLLGLFIGSDSNLRAMTYNVDDKTIYLKKYDDVLGWTSLDSITVDNIDFSKPVSVETVDKSYAGFVQEFTASATYISSNSADSVWAIYADNSHLENKCICSFSKIYNKNILSNGSFSNTTEITNSSEGYVYLFDSVENSLISILPKFNGIDTYVVSKVGKTGGTISNEKYCVLNASTNDEGVLESLKLTKYDLTTGRLIKDLDISVSETEIGVSYILLNENALIRKSIENVKLFNILEDNSLEEILGSTIVLQQDKSSNVIVLDDNNFIIEVISDTSIEYMCVQNGQTVFMATVQKDSDTYNVAGFTKTDIVLYSLNNTVSPNILKIKQSGSKNRTKTYVLTRQDNKISCVGNLKGVILNNETLNLIEFDLADDDNPLYYRKVLSDRCENIGTSFDLLIPGDDCLYSPTEGLIRYYSKRFDLKKYQYNFDKTSSNVFDVNNRRYALSEVFNDKTNLEDKSYRLSVFDLDNCQKQISETILSLDSNDTLIDIPFAFDISTDKYFADVIDGTDYLYLVSGKIISKINTLTGDTLRFDVGSNIIKTKVLTRAILNHDVFLLDGTDKFKTFNTNTGVVTEFNTCEFIAKETTITDMIEFTNDEIVFETPIGLIRVDRKSNTVLDIRKANSIDDGSKYYSDFKQTVSMYERCKETSIGSELRRFRTENFSVTESTEGYTVGYNGSDYEFKTSTKLKWVCEVDKLLFVGSSNEDTPTVLSSIFVYKYIDNSIIFRALNITGDENLAKCVGSAVGVTTEVAEVNIDEINTIKKQGHIILANNTGVNKIFDLIPQFATDKTSLYEAFDSFDFTVVDTKTFTTTDIYKIHLIKSKSNSVIVLGSSSDSSRVILFNKDYETYNIISNSFTREGNTLFVYSMADNLYVGATVSTESGNLVYAYELILGSFGNIVKQNFLGQIILPNIAYSVSDALVKSNNNRMPVVEEIETFCPIIIFIDQIIPISETNQSFIGLNYGYSNGKGKLNELYPIRVRLDKTSGRIKTDMYSGDKTSYKRMLTLDCVNGRFRMNRYSDFYSQQDNLKAVSAGEVFEKSLVGNVAEYYASGKTSERLVEIHSGKSITIRKTDGSYATFDSSEYPFNNEVIYNISGYGKVDGTDDLRFIVFVDVKGNVSTYDRQLSLFVDVNGEIDATIPYFSTEAKILPSKVVDVGSVGKRVWAYRPNNPYSTNENREPDNISVKDDSMLNIVK